MSDTKLNIVIEMNYAAGVKYKYTNLHITVIGLLPAATCALMSASRRSVTPEMNGFMFSGQHW